MKIDAPLYRTIVFPGFPTKVQTTKSRRKQYYKQGDTIPAKYRTSAYRFKDDRIWNIALGEYVIKNAKSVDKPRFQPLSYNKVGTRQKMTVLKLLKEYMIDFLPKKPFKTPVMIECHVYDMPIPLTKDLDNMHIYYKAFLDLLVEQGLLEDDSKQHVTQAGGFTFYPVASEKERKLVFSLMDDTRTEITSHIMYQKDNPVLLIGGAERAYMLVEDNTLGPGEISQSSTEIKACFGKKGPAKAHTHRIFRHIYTACMNTNTRLCVTKAQHTKFKSYIEWLLSEKIPVTVLMTV